MSQTATVATAGEPMQAPGDHHAWQRARDEKMTLTIATDLARQVCQVTAERDYLMTCQQGQPESAAVIERAVATVMDQGLHGRAEELLAGRGPSEDTAAVVDFASLSACAALLAMTCGHSARAATYAQGALSAAPTAACASMAALVQMSVEVGVGWVPLSQAEQAAVVANLAEHRRTRTGR